MTLGNSKECTEQRQEQPCEDALHYPIAFPAPILYLIDWNIAAGLAECPNCYDYQSNENIHILSFRDNVGDILVDVSNKLLTNWYVVAYAELILHSLPRHGLLFLDDGEYLVALAGKLKLRDSLAWFEKGTQHTLLCRA